MLTVECEKIPLNACVPYAEVPPKWLFRFQGKVYMKVVDEMSFNLETCEAEEISEAAKVAPVRGHLHLAPAVGLVSLDLEED